MKILKIFLIFISSVGFISCQADLSLKTDNSYGDELTWSLPHKAEGVLLQAYVDIMTQPDNWDGNNFLDVATDNAVTNDFTSGLYQLTAGGITPHNNPIENWTTAYSKFQYIHLFLENGLKSDIIYDLNDPARDNSIRTRLKGEAYFLRAWWGFDLLQKYGGLTDEGEALGYPIVLKSATNISELNNLSRNTYEECVRQISNDCDSAIKYLPNAYSGTDAIIGETQTGRASGKAAYALKSRLYTYAASPAFQPSGISDGEINDKWIRAVHSSSQAIEDAQIGKYSGLTEADFAGPLLRTETPDEFLFRTWVNNNAMETRNFPPVFFGMGKTNPSQNLVNSFPMKNGFPITDSRSEYDPQNPYNNRDKRLDLTVYYHGRIFNSSRPLEIAVDKEGNPGRDAPGHEYRNTRTGYYLRKWLSSKNDMLFDPLSLTAVNDFHQHPLLRRAEVYFNLAEALNESVGPKGIVENVPYTAVSIINMVRKAAGINSTTYVDEVATMGREAFRNLILNERRIEFAFENMRYFDLRRWLLPLNESVNGVRILQDETDLIFEGTNPTEAPLVVEKRLLNEDKYYYSPIPYEEIIKNPNLIQNKGW